MDVNVKSQDEGDEILDAIEKAMDLINKSPRRENKARCKIVRDLYEMAKEAVGGKDLNIELHMGDVLASSGNFEITGKSIEITDPEVFVEVFRNADVMEMYINGDGTVQMNISFDDITKGA